MIEPTEKPAAVITSEEIARLTAEFLAKGCEVAVLDHGASAFVNGAKPETSMEARARDARTEAIRRRTMKGDKPDVERLRRAVREGNFEIRREFSRDRLNRLVTRYLADEPDALKLLPGDHKAYTDAKKARTLARIQEAVAAGIVGVDNIAKHAGVSSGYLSTLNRQEKLNLPKLPPFFGAKNHVASRARAKK